jgi:hypothetical protein
MLFTIVKIPMDQHVLLNLASIIVVFISFDLWISCGNANIFALVIYFVNDP